MCSARVHDPIDLIHQLSQQAEWGDHEFSGDVKFAVIAPGDAREVAGGCQLSKEVAVHTPEDHRSSWV